MDYQQTEIEKALEDLFRDLADATLTRQRVAHVMGTLAQHVATSARDEALLSLMRSEDVADRLRVSVRRVNALATKRNVGWPVARGIRVFVPEDVERLRPGPTGRPARPREE